ncbi:hypothetical protein ACLMJK_006609 [Lecanora helva]
MTPGTTHEQRTVAEHREADIHAVNLIGIDSPTHDLTATVQFLPGQWLDVHIPGVAQAGGFTITSTPEDLERRKYLELAVKLSPKNPPAAWLWQEKSKILHSTLQIRVGGSFVWPPPNIDRKTIKRLVFVAGGVGIKYVVLPQLLPDQYADWTLPGSPLISILTHLHQRPKQRPPALTFLYSARKDPSGDLSSILFLDRLQRAFPRDKSLPNWSFELFVTNTHPESRSAEAQETAATGARKIPYRRLAKEDLLSALGPVNERNETVCYVCGPPGMTDWAVETIKDARGMDPQKVLCEKWW